MSKCEWSTGARLVQYNAVLFHTRMTLDNNNNFLKRHKARDWGSFPLRLNRCL